MSNSTISWDPNNTHGAVMSVVNNYKWTQSRVLTDGDISLDLTFNAYNSSSSYFDTGKNVR